MISILVFLSVVILIDCATIPTNQQDQLISSTEPVQDYANMKTTQLQETSNDRIGDQLKRCSDYDIVSSSYQPDAVLALSRREISLLERNRERCEACRRNPLCRDDISRCRTCKRICDRVAEQMATSTTTESIENNIPMEPILGQQQPPQFSPVEMTMRFAEEFPISLQEPYFTISSIETGSMMNLMMQLFNVEHRDKLEKFVVLGKLKQGGGSEIVAKSQSLFIWDIGNVFGSTHNSPISTEIHTISVGNNTDNNKKIDLAEELNRELDKAIRKRKEELGQSKLSRDEIDNLVNATMAEVLKRRNETVGCSVEEEEDFEPIVDLRFKQQPDKNNGIIHKTPISNPPVIQDSFDPKLGVKEQTAVDDIIGEPLMSTEAQPLPESDNQVNNARDNYDSSDESSSSSSSSESAENTYVGANQPGVSNLPGSMQNAGRPENLQKDITKIVEDSFKIPGVFGQTGENPAAPQSAQNIQGEVQKIVEDSLKVSTPNNGESTNVDEKVKNIVEDSLKSSGPTDNIVRQQGPDLPIENSLEDKTNNNFQPPRNLQETIQKVVKDSLKVTEPTNNTVRQESPDLPIENQLEDKTNNNSQPPRNLQETIQKVVEDSLKVTQPTDNIVKQQSPDLQLEDNTADKTNIQETVQKIIEEPAVNIVEQQSPNLPSSNNTEDDSVANPELSTVKLESQKDLEEIQKIVDDNLKLIEPTASIVGQEGPNLPNRNKIEEPRMMESSSSPDRAAAQATQTTVTAPSEGMSADKIPKLFPYGIARPIPNTSEYDAFRQFEGMPAERMSKVFPYRLGQPFTALPEEPPNEMNPTINKDTTTPTTVTENATVVVGSPISPTDRGILSNTDGKFHSFGSLIPIPGQNADASTRNVYFLGKDIALPLQMYQDANGIMQLSIDMEKLCNCTNKTCMKAHKHLEEFGNSLLKNIETEQDQGEFKKTSDIMKRSPKIDNYPNDNDNYLEFEDKLNQINKVVKKFEEESENLLEESTKVLLKNVENEGKIEQGVDLINKMLKWMKIVVTEKQN